MSYHMEGWVLDKAIGNSAIFGFSLYDWPKYNVDSTKPIPWKERNLSGVWELVQPLF